MECVVLNYPPVNNTNVVANAAVEFLRALSPFFAFVTAPGDLSLSLFPSLPSSLPPSLPLSLSHTHSLSLSHTHTHTKWHFYNMRTFYQILSTLLCSAVSEGFCNAETVSLEEGSVYWPETISGSEPVILPCPGGQNRILIRQCINTYWTEVDYDRCLSFNDIIVSLYLHAIIDLVK